MYLKNKYMGSKMENKSIENSKHIIKVYTEKAINLLKIYIVIAIISGISYLVGIFLYNSFDFGLIFEILSFVCVYIAFNNLSNNNLGNGKKYIIIAMIPIGWLIIYDFIDLLANISTVLETVTDYYFTGGWLFYYIEPYLYDVTLVANLALLIFAYFSICKADGSKKSDDFTENFYDEL